MRSVIFIEDSSKSLFGGGQKISSFTLSQLSSKGRRLVYVDFVNNPKLQIRLNEKNSDFLKLYHIRRGKLIGMLLNMILVLPNFVKLYRLVLREKKPLIYTTTKRALIYGGILGLMLRVPYIYHAHMVMQGKLYDKAILFLIKHAYKCICVSDYVLSEYETKGVGNGSVLENPVEGGIAEASKRHRGGVFRVAFIGSLVVIKGVKYLLDISNYPSSKGIEIDVYGTGIEQGYLKEQYGSHNGIVFHGFVENVEECLDELIDALVLPTIIAEAAPTVIQQSMLRGVPVITTNIGGQKSLVNDGHTGLLVEPEDSSDILKAILKMKQNPDFYERLSTNCRERAKEFKNMDSFGKNINELVDQVNL